MKNKIFVISLKSDEKRRDELRSNFSNYDEFNIIEAVDGRKMSAKEYYEIAVKSYKKFGKFLSPGEIGCALSHIKAYEEFLKSDSEFALILEDDILGNEVAILRAFELAKKMEDNSVLICGGQNGLPGRFSAFGKPIFEELFLVSNHSKSVITRACAYVISKNSARILLKVHEDAVCVADLWQVLLNNTKNFMYFADLFSHPKNLQSSNLESQRLLKGEFIPNFRTHLRSLKYILFTRFEMFFLGFERIFKR